MNNESSINWLTYLPCGKNGKLNELIDLAAFCKTDPAKIAAIWLKTGKNGISLLMLAISRKLHHGTSVVWISGLRGRNREGELRENEEGKREKSTGCTVIFKLYGCLRGTVEPSAGDHLKMRRVSGRLREVVAYARWSLTRALLHKVFYEEKCGQTYFLERIICMQFLCFSIGKSVLFLKVLPILWVAYYIQRT